MENITLVVRRIDREGLETITMRSDVIRTGATMAFFDGSPISG